MFEIGEKIICIDSSKSPETFEELNRDCPNWIKKGEKYTIRSIQDYDFVVGILLEEVVNKPIYFNLVNVTAEPAFATWRFRKLTWNEIEEENEINEKVSELMEEPNLELV